MEVSTIAEKALNYAEKTGADAAEVYVLTQKGVLVHIEQGIISNESAQEISGIGVRVLKDHAIGFSHIDKLEEKKVYQTIENAYHIAKASVPDPANRLPLQKPLPRVSGVFDKKVAHLQVEDVVHLTKTLLEAALNHDPRVRADMGGIEARVEKEALVNTEGVNAVEERTFLGVFLWGLARENDTVTSSTEDYGYSHQLDLSVEKIGTSFAEKAIRQFGAKKTGSFEGSVILDFSAAAELVVAPLAFGVRGDNIQRNASPLKGKLGNELAVRQLNVVDDGVIDGGMMTKAFDDEGNPRKRTPILEKGVLKSFLFDAYTSRREGVESTGNASRRRVGLFFAPSLPFESPPELLPSNFIIQAGHQTKEHLIEEVEKGIFVGRFSGNTEASNGNFSGAVKQGFLIENGEIKHPLVGTMISGNSYKLLKNISGMSKEHKVNESWRVPSIQNPIIRVENVNITGTI
jgi:PmbA protein